MTEGSRRVWIVLILLVILGSLGWRAGNLNAFSLSNDEGAYLMWAWLVHSGHPLYSETVSVSAPLLIALLDWMFGVAGVGLVSGRILVLGLFALALAALDWCGRQLGDDHRASQRALAGVVAAVAFSVAPMAFSLSRMAMGEIPSLALAVLSVALVMVYARRGRWAYLLLSGLAYSMSMLIKPMNPLVLLPIGWYLLLPRGRLDARGRVLRLAAWGAAALLPVAACLLVYDPIAFYDQVIGFRFDLRGAYPLEPGRNLVWLEYFVRQQWGIVVLGTIGAVMLIRRARWHDLLPLALWLVGAVATVLTHSPLFLHHTIILLPPLVLLAGVAASETWQLLHDRRWALGGLGLAGAAAFVLALPGAAQANQEVLDAGFGREDDAVAVLKQVTRPGDNVISDNLLLAFMAGRQTPPPLGDMAQVAIDSGRQTSERLIAMSEAYPVEAVADWALRLPYMAAYVQWVNGHYLVRKVWDDHHIIYFGRKVAAGELPNPRRVNLSQGIELAGFRAQLVDVNGNARQSLAAAAGGGEPVTLQVAVYWRTSATLTKDYTVFVHLYDATGKLSASHDGPPLYGYLPTSQWKPDEVVPDRHDIALPVGLPAGTYRLLAGMYDAATGERLAVTDARGSAIGDTVELETITIPVR